MKTRTATVADTMRKTAIVRETGSVRKRGTETEIGNVIVIVIVIAIGTTTAGGIARTETLTRIAKLQKRWDSAAQASLLLASLATH